MEKEQEKFIKALGDIEKVLQQNIIIELYKIGITQPDIARNLSIGAGVVNKLLKGVKVQNQYGNRKHRNSEK